MAPLPSVIPNLGEESAVGKIADEQLQFGKSPLAAVYADVTPNICIGGGSWRNWIS
jgi:hypothetical protein